MNVMSVPRAGVRGSLWIARLPFDAAIRLSGRSPETSRAAIAVDRTDAALRRIAGTVLMDDDLVRQADRLSSVASEREEAQRLSTQAEALRTDARQRRRQASANSQRQRRRASSEASTRRTRAAQRRRTQTERIERTEQSRKQAIDESAARQEERLDEAAKRARLGQLDAERQALKEREEALSASDEAERLRRAAAAAKAERKRD